MWLLATLAAMACPASVARMPLCATEADCPAQHICDPERRICILRVWDLGTPDAKTTADTVSPDTVNPDKGPPDAELCDGCAGPGEQIVPVGFSDCEVARCPQEFPHPIGCELTVGGTGQVCVAHKPGDSGVYIQEGDDCCMGTTNGTLRCAASPGGAIDATSCVVRRAGKLLTSVTYIRGGCGGCGINAHCDGAPYQCKYQ